MNELHTVFDITVDYNGIGGDAWFRIAIGLGVAIAGAVWLVHVGRMQAGSRRKFNAVALIGVGVIWLIVNLPLWNLVTAGTDRVPFIPLSGQVEVTEGPVHVTHMQPPPCHANGDKIIIGNRHFEIDYCMGTPGYRQTIAHGGALREGVYARLHHYGSVITKVEVRSDAASPE